MHDCSGSKMESRLRPYTECLNQLNFNGYFECFCLFFDTATIDSGEKGYKLPEQILFNSLPLFPTLKMSI